MSLGLQENTTIFFVFVFYTLKDETKILPQKACKQRPSYEFQHRKMANTSCNLLSGAFFNIPQRR